MRSRNFLSLGLSCCLSMAVCLPLAYGQKGDSLALMPMPSHLTAAEGHLKVDSGFTVGLEGYKEARRELARKRFLKDLSRQTGIPYHLEATEGKPTLVVETTGASKDVQSVGEDESYHLEVTPTNARIKAANPLGAMHGLQTFLQLVAITPEGFAAPAVTIDDSPRFPWRGLMIDAGRHFLYDEFKAMGIKYVPARANFVLVDVGRSASEIYQKLLHLGVIVRPMTSFGMETTLRVTIGTPEENRKLVKALRTVLGKGA